MSNVRHNFNAAALSQRFSNALTLGTNAVMVRLQTEIVQMLGKPGSGRLYVKGANPFSSGAARRTAAVSAISAGGNLRDAGFHQASAPGEPPAANTGNLRRNVMLAEPKPVSKTNRIGWSISLGVVYARALEYGYARRGLAPRPYVKPSIDVVKPLAVRMIANGLIAAGFKARSKT